jgi:hypothetical protein
MAWQQLIGMIEEAAEIDALDSAGTPTSCVADYTALEQGPNGKLVCPWCGLVWPDEASAWGTLPGSY